MSYPWGAFMIPFLGAFGASIGITESFAEVSHSDWASLVAKVGRLPEDDSAD